MNKRQFKADELAYELRHEDAAMGVYNKYNDRSRVYGGRRCVLRKLATQKQISLLAKLYGKGRHNFCDLDRYTASKMIDNKIKENKK